MIDMRRTASFFVFVFAFVFSLVGEGRLILFPLIWP